uniref:Transcriptional regulator, Fis family n=1 Tax=Solibacter usitatus (strain Ellin6076) TaxID=234267 RepID=Q020F4_SOLUE
MQDTATKVLGLLVEVLQRNHLSATEATCLQYLVEHSWPNDPEARQVEALERLLGINARAIGMLIQRLNKNLAQKHHYPAGSEVRLAIAKGGRAAIQAKTNYRVEPAPITPARAPLFWNAHLSHPQDVLLVSNMPLFFRNPEGTERLRVMAVNTKSEQRAHPVVNAYSASFHYVSLGDFRLGVALTRYFMRKGKELDVRLVPQDRNLVDMENPCDVVEVEHTRNLIAIGNSRVSCLVEDRLKKISPNFHLKDGEPNRIYNAKPAKASGEKAYYEDSPKAGGCYHVLLVRSVRGNRTDTVIAVQNGPALERIAPLLTDDEEFCRVVGQRWCTGAMPESFELLFQVEVGENELVQRTANVKLVASRQGRIGK